MIIIIVQVFISFLISCLCFNFGLEVSPSALLMSSGIKWNSSPVQYLGKFDSLIITDILNLKVLS